MTLNDDVKKRTLKAVELGQTTKEEADLMLNMPGPEHIPPIIVYLATDKAWDINGQVFHAEGGRVGLYSEPIEVKSVFKDVKQGPFTTDELVAMVPKILHKAKGIVVLDRKGGRALDEEVDRLKKAEVKRD